MTKFGSYIGILCLCHFIQPLIAQSLLVLSSAGTPSSGQGSLSLSSPAGNEPAGLQFTFSYPTGTTGFTVSPGPALLAAGKSINCAGNASAYTCLATGSNLANIANGVVAAVAFAPPAAASVPIGVVNALAVGPTGLSIPISSAGAVFSSVGLSALQCLPALNGDTCTVTLSAAAPPGGVFISLSSSSSVLSLPAALAIPASAASALFAVAAGPVATVQTAQITASLGSSSVTATVNLTPSYTTLLQIDGTPQEVSGVTNGSTVTPAVSEPGFAGVVMLNGAGSVNFVTGQAGGGTYFLNCCRNTDSAYYKFSGAAVGRIFSMKQGQISFSLQSRYSFAQRQANATTPRYTFDVRDGNGNHQFYFLTQITSGSLVFTYLAGGPGQYYFLPKGTEDIYFGNGVTLNVTLTWNSSTTNLYLNGLLVKSSPTSTVAANWSTASVFDLGAYEYLNSGGYDVSDDAISAFTVKAPVATGTSPVTVSITSPTAGDTVTGLSIVTAIASAASGIAQVQFMLDGATLGSAVTSSGSPYKYVWNTAAATSGSHVLAALATDNSGNTSLASIIVTVNNSTGPVLSAAGATGITSSGAVITWNTDTASDSQVNYGTTTAYGSSSTLASNLVTAHSVTLTGLNPSTIYNYQVLSRDSQGNLSSSGSFQFATRAIGAAQPLLQLHSDATEVTGVTNGAIVTPSIGPAGFTGTVVSNGSGSVNFTPAEIGNGVSFLNCCSNLNTAYYKFSGATIGNIFNTGQGQITFYLKSRYNLAQRQATAASPRYTFDVRDGNGAHLFAFLTQVVSRSLVFNYLAGGSGSYYYVPAGTEDKLFGNGVILQVTISWTSSSVNLYLNNVLVKSAPYAKSSPSWTAASNFDLGAYEYFTFGGYNTSDDVIDEFTVLPNSRQ